MRAKQLPILHKAIILTCAPLVFQIVFVAVLFVPLHNLESVLIQEVDCQEIIAAANAVYGRMIDAAVRGATNAATKASTVERILSENSGLVDVAQRRLSKLTESNPDQSNRVRLLAELTRKVESLAGDANQSQQFERENTPNPLAMLQRYGLVLKHVTPLTEVTRDIVEAEEQKLSGGKVAHRRRIVFTIIGVGLAVELLLCCAMAYLFSVSLVGRLSRVKRNAENFSKGQPLSAAVEGTDEIAGLDASFRKMADAVSAMKTWKQEYLSMINHDVRLPLTAAIGSLGLIERGVYGPLQDNGLQRVQAHSKELAVMVELLEDLLDVEKINADMMQVQLQRMQIADLWEELDSKIKYISGLAGKTISFSEEEFSVSADSDKLSRILRRILTLIGEQKNCGDEIRIVAQRLDNSFTITVSYTGEPLIVSRRSDQPETPLGAEYIQAVSKLLNLEIDVTSADALQTVRLSSTGGGTK